MLYKKILAVLLWLLITTPVCANAINIDYMKGLEDYFYKPKITCVDDKGKPGCWTVITNDNTVRLWIYGNLKEPTGLQLDIYDNLAISYEKIIVARNNQILHRLVKNVAPSLEEWITKTLIKANSKASIKDDKNVIIRLYYNSFENFYIVSVVPKKSRK